ncbi:FtsX-like permease family protein [Rothia sp. AR01]|uniref:FtsX-like permease family protein n=1 Tax=Rothia santali TaxID=2949643 RepID=A0A9X2HCY3_9MICC|nr:ABC transporter permease [Rothia santali]MCP3424834.1 FtsX-like permease family protein [Rothia santali]
MTLFGRKLWRDLREHWAPFTAVCLMAALSVLVFSGLEGSWRGIGAQLESFSASHRLPDAWVSGTRLSDDDARRFEELDGVERAGLVSAVPVTRTGSATEDELVLSTRDRGGLNAPLLRDGTGMPADEAEVPADGVWLDEAYARANDVGPGDRIAVSRGAASAELRVEGLVMQPDGLAHTGSGLVAPDPGSFGYGVVGERAAAELAGGGPVQQTLLVRGGVEAVRAEAPRLLGDRYVSILDRGSHPQMAGVFERVGQIRDLSFLFTALFALVSALSIFTSVRRLVDTQRQEIATLAALGCRRRTIGAYYTAVGAAAVLLGCLLGLGVAPVLSRYILATQRGSFGLPAWEPVHTLAGGAVPLLLLLVCVLATGLAVRPLLRGSPADGLRPEPGRARHTPLERLRPLWRRVSPGARWALRDATGNPVRVAMGIVATAGCMMLLMTGFGMPDTLDRQVDLSYSEQYRYDTLLRLSPAAAEHARTRVAEAAGTGQWMQQSAVRIASHDGDGDGDDGEHPLTVLGEGDLLRLPDRAGNPVALDDGAVLSDRLAARWGLDVGDDLTVTEAGGAQRRLRIAGTTTASEPQGIALSDATWERAGGAFTPTSYLTERPVGPEVRGAPEVQTARTLEQQRESARALVGSLTGVFSLIKVFAVVLAVVVLYNLGLLSFAERVRDYATLRVLGFRPGELRSLASRENLATALLGWLVGLPAGWWFLGRYVEQFSTERAAYAPSISWVSVCLASAITLAFALSATAMLTRRIGGIDMTGALKGVT